MELDTPDCSQITYLSRPEACDWQSALCANYSFFIKFTEINLMDACGNMINQTIPHGFFRYKSLPDNSSIFQSMISMMFSLITLLSGLPRDLEIGEEYFCSQTPLLAIQALFSFIPVLFYFTYNYFAPTINSNTRITGDERYTGMLDGCIQACKQIATVSQNGTILESAGPDISYPVSSHYSSLSRSWELVIILFIAVCPWLFLSLYDCIVTRGQEDADALNRNRLFPITTAIQQRNITGESSDASSPDDTDVVANLDA